MAGAGAGGNTRTSFDFRTKTKQPILIRKSKESIFFVCV